MFVDRLPTYLILTALVTLLLQVARGLFLCVMLGRWLPILPLALQTLSLWGGTWSWPLSCGSCTTD